MKITQWIKNIFRDPMDIEIDKAIMEYGEMSKKNADLLQFLKSIK